VALDPSAQESQGASWSPDGLWIAYYRSKDGKMQIAKIGTGAGATPLILTTVAAPGGSQTRWHPKGDWILYRDATGLALISLDGKQQHSLSERRFSVYGFSKAGDSIYGVYRNTEQSGPEWQLFSVDVKTGAEKFLAPLNLPAATNGISGFSLHPDGKRFAISVGQFLYDIWMLEGFEEGKSWFSASLHK
jgi:Tol biopolymer transport system component